MDQVSEDIGQAQGASEEKLTALKLRANAMEPDGSVVTPEKALLIADSVINPEVKRMISDLYTVYRQALELKATRESMQRAFEARIKAAIEDGRSAAEAKGRKGGEEKKGGGGRYLDAKTMSHMKDNKFGGKDGGAGWNIFLEDMLVIMGSVDAELEQGALEITDLKKKYDEKEGIRGYLDSELYAKYSAELYARLMEVTKDDAQKMVRNGGMKNGWRCGFRALRDLAERYNPKSYMKHLMMLLGVIKPADAKSV